MSKSFEVNTLSVQMTISPTRVKTVLDKDAEQQRCENEAGRVTAEEQRVAAETVREQAETERKAAENARSDAELQRIANEETRKANFESIAHVIQQTTGNSATAVMSQKATTRAIEDSASQTMEAAVGVIFNVSAENNNLFANALKCNLSGEIVSMRDVSPIEHNLDVKVSSKNRMPYPYDDTTKTHNGVTFTDNGDGSITANGTAEGANALYYFYYNNKNICELNTTYTLSGYAGNNDVFLQVTRDDGGVSRVFSKPIQFSCKTNNSITLLFCIKKGVTVDNITIHPQIELGTTATPYTPFVPDVSAAPLKRYGVDETDNLQEYPIYLTGEVPNVKSLYPSTTLTTDTPGVLIECEYNRDITKALATIEQAILSLGGNV